MLDGGVFSAKIRILQSNYFIVDVSIIVVVFTRIYVYPSIELPISRRPITWFFML